MVIVCFLQHAFLTVLLRGRTRPREWAAACCSLLPGCSFAGCCVAAGRVCNLGSRIWGAGATDIGPRPATAPPPWLCGTGPDAGTGSSTAAGGHMRDCDLILPPLWLDCTPTDSGALPLIAVWHCTAAGGQREGLRPVLPLRGRPGGRGPLPPLCLLRWVLRWLGSALLGDGSACLAGWESAGRVAGRACLPVAALKQKLCQRLRFKSGDAGKLSDCTGLVLHT